ncbi:ras-related protein Rab-7L1-like isoform X2 [Seriola dumerili]|uniref:ras-related protein Rab-7L1-like isoform X2 n=1 Tax=Seriola dumerili TaxID=41447 RepID=UPI000BBF1D4E|nr:ras-related protein Rab-7L1-like isoform X2 [Seriola dumerili]
MTEHLLKILIVGDGNVGKSSFVHRYVNGQFNKTYKMTVGVDFSVKLLHWSDKEKVRLQLWDVAGQERFISMTRIYYKGALGCVMMFDVTSASSFLNCRHWKQDLDNKAILPNGHSIPCILLANKASPWSSSNNRDFSVTSLSGLCQQTASTDSVRLTASLRGWRPQSKTTRTLERL